MKFNLPSMFRCLGIILLVFFFAAWTVPTKRGENDAKWKKIHDKLADRCFDNLDSCLKAAKLWYEEVNAKGDAAWTSKAACLVGKCCYLGKNYTEAEAWLLQSLKKQDELNDQHVLAMSNYYLAMTRYDAKNYDDAIPYFKLALKAFPLSEGNKWTEGNAHFIYGYVLYTKKDIEGARKQFDEAIEIFEGYVDSKILADCYNYSGDNEYFEAKNYKDGVQDYINAAKKYDAVEYFEDAAYARHTAGEIYYFYLNNTEAAIEQYEKSWEFYEKSDNTKQKASLSRNLANAYSALHENDKAARFYLVSAEYNNKLGKPLSEGDDYVDAADIYYFGGKYPESLKYYRIALGIFEKENSTRGQANCYIGLGNFYQRRGDDQKSREMYTKSLEFYQQEKEPNYSGMSSAYIGLGNSYNDPEDFDKSLEYYLKAIECEDKGPEKDRDKSVPLMNIANIYMTRDDDENTEKYLTLAIDETGRSNNEHRRGNVLKLRGYYYNRKKESKKAMEDCSAALKIMEKQQLLPEEMECYRCMYYAAYNMENFQDAVSYYQSYISARDSINNEKRNTEINKRELQYEYEKREAQLKMEDERKQFALQEEIKRKQLFFEFEAKQSRMKAANEKREIAMREEIKRKNLAIVFQREKDSVELNNARRALRDKKIIQEKELERKQETIRTAEQRKLTYWAFGGLCLVAVLLIFILKGYRDKQKANKIILKQKEETEQQKEIIEMKGLQLEEKNREIIDSINYARRLQEAILPPAKLVKQYLNDSFILYKPRDIVAGDFYWMETINLDEKVNSRLEGSRQQSSAADTNAILFAVADCTGHGVPGAMVSVVCSGALNRALKEFHLTDPGQILDKVRELVLETFEKSESQVKDGMDISLCLLNIDKKEVKWAGANNPLWIVRHKNGEEAPNITHIEEVPGFELMEIKADKQPIGATDKPKPFTTHTLQLEEGSILYMTTDGYADQFGGHKGKKFKDSNMKKLILEICQQNMDKQMQLMEKSIEAWKGQLEQVDDICVVGVRV